MARMRKRITTPTLIRSSNQERNRRIVHKAKRQIKRIEKTRAVGVFLKNAFGTKDRFIYIGT